MGFFSKIWKGVKKTFKKIGKGIKKAFKSVGKFMGKIGIVGTIALTLLTGGLGGLGGIFTGFGTKLGALGMKMGGIGGSILKGASWTIGKAAQFGSAIKSGFSTLTKGVTEFFGQAGKYIGNKLGIIQTGPKTLGEAWGNYSSAMTKQFETFKGNVGDLFTKTSPTLEAGKAAYQKQVQDLLDFDPSSYDTDILDPQKLASGDIKAPSLLDARNAPLDPLNPTVGSQATLPVDTIKPPSITEYTDPAFDITQPAMDLPKTPTTNLLSNTPAGTVPASAGTASAKQGFFAKLSDPQSYIDPITEGITEVPGAVITQKAMNMLTGTPDVPEYFASYQAPTFSSGDTYGAVSQGLTSMGDDGFKDMTVAYDALGVGGGGGYGPSQLYSQRMRSMS